MDTLILFDIDGTLMLYTDDFPHRLFEEMTGRFFGTTISLDEYRFSGKTDKRIISEMSVYAGVSDERLHEQEPEIVEWISMRLEEHIGEDSFALLPNVKPLLDILSQRADTTLALLTGNLERCAELKLEQFDLMQYFEFGAYGIESRDRNDLGPIALRKFEDLSGRRPENVVVIGDTIADVHVAKHIGARSVITLTGRTTREEIAPHDADHIFDNLMDTDAVIKAIYH